MRALVGDQDSIVLGAAQTEQKDDLDSDFSGFSPCLTVSNGKEQAAA